MKIWVDADACPKVIKNILYKAANRTKIMVIFVANRFLNVPSSMYIDMIKVSSGFDVADDEIVKRVNAGDLVITADIPLAAQVIEKGASALNPRGELYDPESIKGRLAMRDFMDTLRASGVDTGGPPALNQKDRTNFANQLDQIIGNYLRNKK
jgi:uncharacterized protein